jgi:hypothetical protein
VSILKKAWSRLPASIRRMFGFRSVRQAAASRRAIARHNARQAPNARTLNFFPEPPLPRAQMVGMLELIGMRIGNDTHSGPQIAWQRGTWLNPADQARLPEYAINRACTDVSKSHVDALWANIAGYSITVDPLVTSGRMIEKSEENAVHQWRAVNGPLPRRRPGMVYERFIDAVVGEHFVQSRPVIMRGQIPLMYGVHFPRQHWHADAVMFPIEIGDVYSPDEVALILAFAAAIGIEYGEFDVLRATAPGRIFVIAANPPPARPHQIPPPPAATTLRRMADAFAEIFAADLAR